MKLKIGFGIFVSLLFSAVVHAQTLPCGGEDPDATCPIDTWVIVLVIIASVFAVSSLARKGKAFHA
jgi:hypothetical protein